MTNRQYDIYILLEAIRKRPGMYLGECSLVGSHTFLVGYPMAMHEMGATDTARPEFQGFHDWVARKFGFAESTAGWCNMILAVTLGLDPAGIVWEGYADSARPEQKLESLRRFFELLDQYRQQ